MLKDHQQIRIVSIVFIGDFNPVIVQPYWLASKKLIKDKEAEDINVELIHNELNRFDLGWASIEITKKRFEIRTSKEPYFEPIKDLILSIFSLLPETPIESLGINHIFHFALPDKTRYYEFGNKLAPLSKWEGVLHEPRVLQFEITEQQRIDKLPGYLRVKVNPSDQKLQFGVSININDHYSLDQGETGRQGELIARLRDNWSNSFSRADEIIERLSDKIL
jgi:hypothetical protein